LTPNSRSYITRFTQPDSIIPDIYDPLSLDPYQYVRSNPINFNDPSGHKWTCVGANDDHCYDDGNFIYPGGDGGLSGMAPNKGSTVEQDQYSWQKITYNMINLGIYGNSQAAASYVVEMEFSNGSLNENATLAKGTQGYDELEGMKNKYAEYCDAAWSAICVENYYGYHQPILNSDPHHAKDYYSDEQWALIPQFATIIINATGDPNAGCPNGSANICQYANAPTAAITWAQNQGMKTKGGEAWAYNPGIYPAQILHMYNNFNGEYFETLSQAMYERWVIECPQCVY